MTASFRFPLVFWGCPRHRFSYFVLFMLSCVLRFPRCSRNFPACHWFLPALTHMFSFSICFVVFPLMDKSIPRPIYRKPMRTLLTVHTAPHKDNSFTSPRQGYRCRWVTVQNSTIRLFDKTLLNIIEPSSTSRSKCKSVQSNANLFRAHESCIYNYSGDMW